MTIYYNDKPMEVVLSVNGKFMAIGDNKKLNDMWEKGDLRDHPILIELVKRDDRYKIEKIDEKYRECKECIKIEITDMEEKVIYDDILYEKFSIKYITQKLLDALETKNMNKRSLYNDSEINTKINKIKTLLEKLD